MSLGLMAASLIGSAAFAGAEDRGPPRVTLRHGVVGQTGGIWSTTWTSSSGPNGCVVLHGDGIPRMGGALHVGAGLRRLRIRFHTAQHPYRGLVIRAWTAIDADRLPVGPSRRLDYRLVKEGHGEQKRWAALINARVSSDVYLNAFARWKDKGPCGGVDNAAWTFHIAP